MSILTKIDATVSPLCSQYFKKVWLEQTKLSERQYRNRMKEPTIEDVLLFCHVCKVDEKEILQPLKSKFNNIAPFNTNLQMTID